MIELHSTVVHSGLAYVDPGSGSIAVQLFLAAMLSVGYTMRSKITQVIARIRRKAHD
ncbi:MAG TPA: hypothetical protein VMI31_00535 [Fimbriimonadaceae bacterium]|nr:hypothetical protein [Fimbriimonadaceae bacterium]